MKKWILGVLAVGLLVLAYGMAAEGARKWLIRTMSEATQRPVAVRAIHPTFPPGVAIVGITVPADAPGKATLVIPQVALRLSFLSILRGRPGLDLEITRPQLSIHRDSLGELHLPWGAGRAGKKSGQGALALARLRLRAGEVTFLDQHVNPSVTFRLRDVRVSAAVSRRPGEYLASALSEFADPSGKRVGGFKLTGNFFFEGTSKVDVSFQHEALAELAPYVRPVLGSAPTQGSLELNSRITIHEEKILAENTLTAEQVTFAASAPTILGPMGSRLVELLQDDSGRIHLTFMVHGRLGEPLDWSDLMTSALREAMRNALAKSIHKTLTEVEEIKPFEELIKKGLESLGR